ncbi:MAG: OB-fold nucleic acid binding domain-containing protein [Candidatus ainarchaeum sp.]|nr:OB-fold nucleic acid binding domain-containing protein [Candidatus ainarchaeum sp.]
METTSISLVEKIVAESGKPKEEILEKIESKKEKFAGLLTESGAALMVAKELGLELDKSSERMKIKQLEDGMSNVDLLVKVMQIFAPKEFEKNGKKGRLCNLIVADDSGEIRLTLWHDDVKKIQEQGAEKGSVLELKNCYVTSFKEKAQLNLSYQGELSVNPTGVDSGFLPKIENKVFRLDELQPGLSDVNAIVRILRVFPATEFKKENVSGKVANFLIADKTNSIRATAWNDIANETEKLAENDLVKIEGAYTKQGLKGIELHLGYKARIIKNPKIEEELPSAMELRGIDVTKKKISNLHKDDALVEINGKILEIGSGKLLFNTCPKCGKKAIKMEESFLCENCGEQKESVPSAVISVKIGDESGSINSVFYGKTAEELIGLSAKEIEKKIAEAGLEETLDEIRGKLWNSEITLQGKIKENSFSSELEITARSIEKK